MCSIDCSEEKWDLSTEFIAKTGLLILPSEKLVFVVDRGQTLVCGVVLLLPKSDLEYASNPASGAPNSILIVNSGLPELTGCP
jgi:hypothetical protein